MQAARQIAASLLPAPVLHESPELLRLRQDNASLRARTRTMETALTALLPRAEELPTPIVMGAYGQGSVLGDLITDARTLEALGDVVAIRFIRNDAGEIAGVELAALRSDDETEGHAPGFRVLARLGMSVVA